MCDTSSQSGFLFPFEFRELSHQGPHLIYRSGGPVVNNLIYTKGALAQG